MTKLKLPPAPKGTTINWLRPAPPGTDASRWHFHGLGPFYVSGTELGWEWVEAVHGNRQAQWLQTGVFPPSRSIIYHTRRQVFESPSSALSRLYVRTEV